MIKGTTRVLTLIGEIPLWKLQKGTPVMVNGKSVDSYMTKRTRREQMFAYTITTYAGEFSIVCSPRTLIVTEKGDIEIDKLTKDLGIYVRGVAHPTRLSVIKNIKKKKDEEVTGVIINQEIIVNGLMVNGKQLFE